MMSHLLFLIFCLWSGSSRVTSSPSEDRITLLPGLPSKPDFEQYSGYLNGGNGRNLFYWFTQSNKSPSLDPVLLWLNGGPGSSSLLGLFQIIGAYKVNSSDNSKLYYNTNAWNQGLNVLYLESPAGVGFSYPDDGNETTSDDYTANGNLNALVHFFQKFPSFRKNDFFIFGESYGGMYIPTLGRDIINHNKKVGNSDARINLRGFGIGNGWIDTDAHTDSIQFLSYARGEKSQEEWDAMVQACCPTTKEGEGSVMACRFSQNSSPACKKARKYNDDEDSQSTRLHTLLKRSLDPDDAMESYLNLPEVRRAIHASPKVAHWKWGTYIEHKRQYRTVKEPVLYLLNNGIKGMIYNGDGDWQCDFLSARLFVKSLNLPVSKPFEFWKNRKGNDAGTITYYGDKLQLVTIKGAYHMAPADKPEEALVMMETYIKWVFQ